MNGLGKIGQRHYKNLLSLGYKNVFGWDVDKQKTKNIQTPGPDTKFDIVLICNPTHLHVKTALQYARQGSDIFIEKTIYILFEKKNCR